jgi:hypothetical protein
MNKEPRFWDSLLPAGTHKFTVHDAERVKSQHTERWMWRVTFRVEGTNRLEVDFFSEHTNAAWKWEQMGLESIDELGDTIGETFLVEYTHENWMGTPRGKLRSYLGLVTT